MVLIGTNNLKFVQQNIFLLVLVDYPVSTFYVLHRPVFILKTHIITFDYTDQPVRSMTVEVKLHNQFNMLTPIFTLTCAYVK